ncbi:MAG: AMP-binding protein [Fluviicola sp.]
MQLHFHTDDQNIRDSVEAFVEQWNNSDDFFQVKTSGSTGKPKTIHILKSHARASANMTGSFLGLYKNLNALLCLSPETIAGKMMIVRALEWKLHLHVVAPSSDPFENIKKRMHFVAMVPYQVLRTIENSSEKFHEHMQLIIGGGPIAPTLEKQIQALPCTAYHTFGMTETISHIALRNISLQSKRFRLLTGVTAKIVHGKMHITAPHLGVKDLVTNDSVEFYGDREFEWRGRLDFVINSGGIKIHPEEVEDKLSQLFDVPFFVVGIPDDQLGEKLVLCLESAPFPISKKELETLLPKYHVPRSVFFFPEFVYTKSGKINRFATLACEKRNEQSLL